MGSFPASVECRWDGKGMYVIRVGILYLLLAMFCFVLFCYVLVAMFLLPGLNSKWLCGVNTNAVHEGIMGYGWIDFEGWGA